VNLFPDQTGSFNYLFGFQPNSGAICWEFNFGNEETFYDEFSNPEQKQSITYNSDNLEVSSDYLFLSNPSSGLIEVYNNPYIQDKTSVNEYQKNNRITGDGVIGMNGFGDSIKASDDILIVGASIAPINSKQEVGAVFLFNEFETGGLGSTGNGGWGQSILITGTQESGLFGKSISTLKEGSEHIVAVGAAGENSGSGSVYIYDQTLSNFVKKINSQDAGVQNFGKSLFFSRPNSSYLMVGADQFNSGIVKIFKESVSGGEDFNINGYVKPDQGHGGDMFGYSIDGDDRSFMVGAPNENQSGSVYYYEYNDESGVFELAQYIKPYDLGLGDYFGKNISVDNDLAVITSNRGSGKAYIYKRNQGVWSIKSELSGTLDNTSGSFGGNTSGSFNTALKDDSLIIGSAENEINYYFTTGNPIKTQRSGFSMSGVEGKFYDNDGNFLYGYNQFEQVVISGNVFSGNHNIFINGNVLNSNCSRNSGTLNSWSVTGESGLSYYYMSIIDVED
jgi:hypothetical protein